MDKPTNPLDLEEIKGLMAEAGLPWFVIDHPGEEWTIQDRAVGGGACIANKYGDGSKDRAALIVAAVNALPTLIEQYERMREALAHAADMCAVYADFIRNRVTADEIEVHPYLPAIEDVIANARSALNQQEETK